VTAHFVPITRRTLSEEVREALLTSIRNGELAPGGPVPSERSLCEQFGVARTSVREAIQGLMSLGLVERRGNRTYVSELMPEVSLADTRKRSVAEIFEVRRLVEVPMAELAACRARDGQRDEIRQISRSFKSTMSLEEFRQADHRFHAAVAAACGNPSLAELYGKVLEALFESTDFDSLLSASANESVVRRVIRDASKAHRDIATSLCTGDVEAVRKAAEEHLNQVEALMVAQMT
jgi:GntR family transcriptional repressor for pyruvate dehydrogenase complex